MQDSAALQADFEKSRAEAAGSEKKLSAEQLKLNAENVQKNLEARRSLQPPPPDNLEARRNLQPPPPDNEGDNQDEQDPEGPGLDPLGQMPVPSSGWARNLELAQEGRYRPLRNLNRMFGKELNGLTRDERRGIARAMQLVQTSSQIKDDPEPLLVTLKSTSVEDLQEALKQADKTTDDIKASLTVMRQQLVQIELVTKQCIKKKTNACHED